MVKFILNSIIGVFLLLCITSCNTYEEQTFSFTLIGDSINVNSSSDKYENTLRIHRIRDKRIKRGYGFEELKKRNQDFHFKKNSSFKILDIIRDESSLYEVALQLIENDKIEYKISINDKIDTILSVKPAIKINTYSNEYAFVNKGVCAKFETNENKEQNRIIEIRRWLYDNNIQKNDSIIKGIINIASQLNSKSYVEYETLEKIPVIKDFSKQSYDIKTNVKADYYYLFATNKKHELDDFVKEVCVTNFEGGHTDINKSLPCYRLKDKSGILCIFMIGVNKDWSKTIMPLGLIAVDNIPPIVYSPEHLVPDALLENQITDVGKYTYIFDNIWIKIPLKNEPIKGQLAISTNEFRGDNANFEFCFGGDVKSISINREIHRSYKKYRLKPETKVIRLDDKKSPYYFTYELDLAIGDNYIPIKVEDKAGNVTEYSYKITMVQVENNNPQINIDNNIDIWD